MNISIEHFIKYKYLIIILCILLIPLFIVNCFKYSDVSLIKVPLLNIVIYKTGLETYVSIITVISLLFAVLQWQINNKNQRLADINCLLEELRHNANILGNFYYNCDFINLFKEMSKELDSMEDLQIYPNPTDDIEEEFKYHRYLTYSKSETANIVSLRCQFINTILSSRYLYTIKPKRIFLNLGHLKYSIDRHNKYVENHNNTTGYQKRLDTFHIIQQEYYRWLHFRFYYLLIDLIKNISINDVIDKNYYKDMIKKIEYKK